MLNETAFANAFAAAFALLYLGLYFLRLIAPPFFKLLLNSQLLGADIASQVPQKIGIPHLLGILIAVSTFAWITGYLIANFYNRFHERH